MLQRPQHKVQSCSVFLMLLSKIFRAIFSKTEVWRPRTRLLFTFLFSYHYSSLYLFPRQCFLLHSSGCLHTDMHIYIYPCCILRSSPTSTLGRAYIIQHILLSKTEYTRLIQHYMHSHRHHTTAAYALAAAHYADLPSPASPYLILPCRFTCCPALSTLPCINPR